MQYATQSSQHEGSIEESRTTRSPDSATDLGSAPGGGNQALLDAMYEGSPECALDDDGCFYEADLDEILGDGAAEWIHSLTDNLNDRCLQGIVAFARVDLPCDDYLAHFDGADRLAAGLDDAAVRLLESAHLDPETAELSWDAVREDRVHQLAERAGLAIEVLDALLLLNDQDRLVALGEAITVWSQHGTDVLRAFQIRASAGEQQLRRLSVEFEKHRALMEKALSASSKDVATLLVGPLSRVGDLGRTFNRLWLLSNAFNTIGTEPEGWYETVKTFKTIGFAAAGEAARTLAKDNPFRKAWTPLSVLVNTCQTAIDLTEATTELAMMKHLLDLAIQVKEEYGREMALYTAMEPLVLGALDALHLMSGASDRVHLALEDAEALVSQVGDPATFYDG